MNENKLTIIINKPSSQVFAYYTNPQNTPLWWDSVSQEITSDWPIKVGTVYKSQNKVSGNWSEFVVSDYKEDEVFELTSKDGNYHVLYTHKETGPHATELTYYEWVDNGALDGPFDMPTLEKLKHAIERV
jgi:hypothetical protein